MKFKTLLVTLLIAYATAAQAVSVNVSTGSAHCGLSNGWANAYVTGGAPPYTFLWNTGVTTQTLTGLGPGTYSVTVTDANGEVANGSGVILNDPQLADPVREGITPICESMCSGSFSITENQLGGTAPYAYTVNGPGIWTGSHDPVVFSGLCLETQTITITDANGCSLDIPGLWESLNTWSPSILSELPACGSQANGSINLGGQVIPWSFQGWDFQVTGTNGFDSTYSFPSEPIEFGGLPPDDYVVSILPYAVCTGPANATVGNIPEPCGSISGIVFNDADGNCVQDVDDIGLPLRVMTLEPGPFYAFTNSTGQFHFSTVGFGNFTLSQPLYNESQLCPPTTPIAVTIDGATPTVDLAIADSSHIPLDLEIVADRATMRPGFNWGKYIYVRNLSPYPSGPVTVTVDYDPSLDPVANGSAGVATWSFPSLAPYASQTFAISGTLPPSVPLGTTYEFLCAITNTLQEASLANNVYQVVDTVVGSFDPNDKLGYTNASRSGSQYFLDQDAWIDYTIRFQNTGTDTAFTVVVRDTLDADLDIASLDIIGASHAFDPSFDQGRVLTFTFNQILLPDSGTDQLGSQGSVSYRIKPRAGLMIGDEIENTAGIYFDFNDPVLTNTVTHVVETSTGIEAPAGRVIRLAPNPVSDVLFVMDLQDAKGTIEVLAADGRRMEVPHVRTGSTLQLDVHALAPGLYILRTVNGIARFVKH